MGTRDARWRLLDRATQGGHAELRLQTAGGATATRTLVLPVPQANSNDVERDPLADSGLALAVPNPTVRGVVAGSAGERDGLRQGDRIVGVADIDQPDTRQLIDIIQQHGELPLNLTVLRDGAHTATAGVVSTGDIVHSIAARTRVAHWCAHERSRRFTHR